ncbi:GNAT family N-acetyltransferase [Haloterrigena alkaliphila]|uniref:GNAT family N-acetyltransferase n=1 Tax=Haloterrigena alkaliphila TaxID=2816475 RepID=A0A8A2VFX9_9EURY|nr:GNAT family N-acetyltransferase [Haloterrigena alkaliphila]QSW99567.1 GNAT family N-acetyltransferase [Haloterrigena alkaliphila]
MVQTTAVPSASDGGEDGATATSESIRTLTESASGLEVRVLETIRAIPAAQWNDVVEQTTCGSVFHRHEWLDAIEIGLEYTPRHLVVEKDGNLIGLLPNFVVDIEKTPFRRLSSSYPGFGGPLVTTDVPESLSLLTEAATDLCSGRTVVHQIRGLDTNYLRYNNFLQAEGYEPYRRECRFVLDLTQGYEEIREGMSKSRQKGIDRGRDGDYEIVEEPLTRSNIARFHEVYERVMHRVDGDVYPLSFFERLLAMDSRLLLVTIRIDGEYAGGFLELIDEERSSIHGFFAAVPQEYFGDHASELLYDHVIKWGIDNGFDSYDFGSSNADFEDGVFRFKEGFGATPMPILVWERGCSPLWRVLKTGRSLYWPHK